MCMAEARGAKGQPASRVTEQYALSTVVLSHDRAPDLASVTFFKQRLRRSFSVSLTSGHVHCLYLFSLTDLTVLYAHLQSTCIP